MAKPQFDQEGVARIIRMEYKRWRELRTGRKYSPNPRHDKTENWLAAADNCIALGADPVEFVAACFEQCTATGGPFANQLCGPGARNWWHAANPQKSADDAYVLDEPTDSEFDRLLKFEFEQAITILYRLTKTAETHRWRDAILSFMTPIAPCVRVSLGFNMPGVIEQWGEKAYEEISTNPRLFNGLKKLGFDLSPIIKIYGNQR